MEGMEERGVKRGEREGRGEREEGVTASKVTSDGFRV
jgi:hypothetical protein